MDMPMDARVEQPFYGEKARLYLEEASLHAAQANPLAMEYAIKKSENYFPNGFGGEKLEIRIEGYQNALSVLLAEAQRAFWRKDEVAVAKAIKAYAQHFQTYMSLLQTANRRMPSFMKDAVHMAREFGLDGILKSEKGWR